jgi:hypothetical protein
MRILELRRSHDRPKQLDQFIKGCLLDRATIELSARCTAGREKRPSQHFGQTSRRLPELLVGNDDSVPIRRETKFRSIRCEELIHAVLNVYVFQVAGSLVHCGKNIDVIALDREVGCSMRLQQES